MNENLRRPLVDARKRRMLLILPVLIIPFLTLAFWALGGGRGEEAGRVENRPGLNTRLPDPKMKMETLDKLGFYDKADKDSLKRVEEMRNDPFYSDHSSIEKGNELEQMAEQTAGKYHQSLSVEQLKASPYETNPNFAEQRLMEKLSELNRVVTGPSQARDRVEEMPADNKLEQLQATMEAANEPAQGDTELRELNSMMDKIIRIQHPEEIKEKKLVKNETFLKISSQADDTVTTGFYSMEVEASPGHANAISAVVDEDQTLTSGAIIRLRLTGEMYIREEKIPIGTSIFGLATLNGERLNIEISSICSNASVYPVKLQVFDLDGLTGIYVPGAITWEVAKQSTDKSLQNLQLASLDPSLVAQATSAGITTVKELLSRRVKLVKVVVKKGYQILIKNETL